MIPNLLKLKGDLKRTLLMSTLLFFHDFCDKGKYLLSLQVFSVNTCAPLFSDRNLSVLRSQPKRMKLKRIKIEQIEKCLRSSLFCVLLCMQGFENPKFKTQPKSKSIINPMQTFTRMQLNTSPS